MMTDPNTRGRLLRNTLANVGMAIGQGIGQVQKTCNEHYGRGREEEKAETPTDHDGAGDL